MWNPFSLLRRDAPVSGEIPSDNLETRDVGVTDPNAWLQAMFGAPTTTAGITVNASNAMKSTAVRAAVQTIAEAIGTLPLPVYARGTDGSKERDRDHAVYGLLNGKVNPWTSASDFREQLTRDALLHGNGFAAINRVNGEIREINRLDPASVTVEVNEQTGEPTYKQTGTTPTREYAWSDILHIRAPGVDGVCGVSPVTECKEAIALSMVLERHANGLFGNGARPGGVIEFPGKLAEEALGRMKAGWRSAHEGSANAGKTAILWDGATFRPLTFNSVDAQFLEMRRFAVEEIARVFRVPPHMLFEMGRATWGNAGEMGASFLRFTLLRWLVTWQAEISLKLFSETEQETHFAEFLVDALLQVDIAARAEAYSKLIAARVLNPNEARAMENRAPYEGGDEFSNPNIEQKKPPQAAVFGRQHSGVNL